MVFKSADRLWGPLAARSRYGFNEKKIARFLKEGRGTFLIYDFHDCAEDIREQFPLDR